MTTEHLAAPENTADPVGSGFVDSLPQPSGNATGFMLAGFLSARCEAAGEIAVGYLTIKL
jgi:hypothetical protein